MYKSKKIKKAKIPVTVDNVTKEQLTTLKLELRLLAEPWRKQGVTIQVGKKASMTLIMFIAIVLFLAPSFSGGLLLILS
jgi:hypothetical protein